MRHLPSACSGQLPDRLAWTPDGRAVLVGVVSDGVWRIMRVPIDGGALQFDSVDLSQLTGPITIPPVRTATGSHGGISKDGSRIVFGAMPSPMLEVWALDPLMAVLAGRH